MATWSMAGLLCFAALTALLVVHHGNHARRTTSLFIQSRVFLKWESQQFTASFKERGALVRLLALRADQRRRGVIAVSAGNHAQGVAYHAQRLGIHAVIVMPILTPNVKVDHTRAFGAEVILHGTDLDQASRFTRALARQRKLTLIHPYDDTLVIAGQGTAALEMLEAQPEIEILVAPVGGGGLIAGSAIAAKGINPGIEVVGVQSASFPAVAQLLEGAAVHCTRASLAEGIAVRQPGRRTMPIIRELVDDVLVVDEVAIERAVLMLLEIEKAVVEGAGAVGLAALLTAPERFRRRTVGLILSGGNIDLPVLSNIILRGMARSGRMVRLRVELPDIPGALAQVAACIGEARGNIVDVSHQRSFTKVPIRSAELEVTVQTRGLEHVQELLAALVAAGFPAAPTDPELVTLLGSRVSAPLGGHLSGGALGV